MSTEFFDEEGELIATPDDWKAQELLGFESTYPCATLEQIIADIDAFHENPSDWPFHTAALRPLRAASRGRCTRITTASRVTTATGRKDNRRGSHTRESRFFHVGRRQMCKDILQPCGGAAKASTYARNRRPCHKGVLQNPHADTAKGVQYPSQGERFSTLKAPYTGLCKELRGSRDTAKRGSEIRSSSRTGNIDQSQQIQRTQSNGNARGGGSVEEGLRPSLINIRIHS